MLGASKFTIFRRIIFPELRPALLTGFGLAFARGLGEYGRRHLYFRQQCQEPHSGRLLRHHAEAQLRRLCQRYGHRLSHAHHRLCHAVFHQYDSALAGPARSIEEGDHEAQQDKNTLSEHQRRLRRRHAHRAPHFGPNQFAG